MLTQIMHPLIPARNSTIKNVSFHICITIQNTPATLKTCPTKTSRQKTIFCEMSHISDYEDYPAKNGIPQRAKLETIKLEEVPSSGMCTASPTLMNMAAVYSEMSEYFYQITRCHIPHQTLLC
jgi:hypothetical protein